MRRKYIPSEGPVLDGEANTALAGVRGTLNAAPAAPAAAATAAIFAAGEVINVRTRVANEQIRCTLNVERDNAGAAGNGLYSITSDGVAVGTARTGPTGTSQQGTTVIDCLITIAAAGSHAIGAQVTSVGDVETVLAGARLTVEANEFA